MLDISSAHENKFEKSGYGTGTGGLYGAKGQMKAPFVPRGGFVPFAFLTPMRRRVDGRSLAIIILIPLFVFCLIFWMQSFFVHDLHPFYIYFVEAICLIAAAAFAVKSYLHRREQEKAQEATPWWLFQPDPTWFLFLACTTALACVAGWVLGQMIYGTNMDLYYQLSSLGNRHKVDPADGGKAYMDAGTIVFHEGAYVDRSMSIGYKDTKIWCVAPITMGKDKLANYDFYAVGMDCCNGFPGDFNCGTDFSPLAHGAVRLMDDDARAYYRLAVQMLEEEYFSESIHPLFFHWVRDPVDYVASLRRDGILWFIYGVVGFVVLQGALAAGVAYLKCHPVAAP